MRCYRCYHPDPIQTDQQLWLSSDASHHLAVVLRAKVGHGIEVFDSAGGVYRATITHIGKRGVSVCLEGAVVNNAESSLTTHLVQAVGKGDKVEWVIQKAVELGVSEITLVLTERTEVRVPQDQWQKKMAHWHGIMINAVQQSNRVKLPKLNPPIPLLALLKQATSADLKLMLHVNGSRRLSEVVPATFNHAQLLIGPEGGFSPVEAELAADFGYQVVNLGARVLRTETAPLVILSVLQYLQDGF
jgi:16S rRNA (uracil1498-N3)-methyltransferase